MLTYHKQYCENCKKHSSGIPSFLQNVIITVLFFLGLIPAIIYFFLAKPKRCYICGLKMTKNENNN